MSDDMQMLLAIIVFIGCGILVIKVDSLLNGD